MLPPDNGVEAASSVSATVNGADMEASVAETLGSKHPPTDALAAAAKVQKDEELMCSLNAVERFLSPPIPARQAHHLNLCSTADTNP